MGDIKNITYGKPAIGGAISVAKVGSKLPTDATTKIDVAFKNLGYISEDGLENENSPDTENVKAWGGDSVLVINKGKEDTFSFTLIEALNVEVLKFIYGADNVTGTLETGIVLNANAKAIEDVSMVIEVILKGNVLRRFVLPSATITEIGTVTYKDDEAVGYEITVLAKPDTNGNTHYEYIKKAGV